MIKVEFGVHELTDDKGLFFTPFIALNHPEFPSIEFLGNLSFRDLDDARKFVVESQKAICQPNPPNFKYDREGNA